MFLVFAPHYSGVPEPSQPTTDLKSESPCSISDISPSQDCFPGTPRASNNYQFVEHSKRKETAVRSQVSKHVMKDYVHRRAELRHSVHFPKLQWIVKKETPTRHESPEAELSPDVHQTGPRTHVIRFESSNRNEKLRSQDTGEAASSRNPWDPRKATKKSRGHLSATQVHTSAQEYFETPASPPGNATDPFQTLPERTTRMEQIILQHYLDVLPERLYRIRKDAPLNPNRCSIFPLVHTNAAVFQWCLISAACHYRDMGGQVDDSYIIQRRSKAYQIMKEGLADSRRCMSDEVFLGIHAAVWVEARYGDPSATELHVYGLSNFLKRRGGVRSMIGKSWHVFVVQGLHLAGTGLNISSVADVEELRQQTETLTDMLTNIQEADIELREWQSNLSYEETQRTAKSGLHSDSAISMVAPRDSLFPPLSPPLTSHPRGIHLSTSRPPLDTKKHSDSGLKLKHDTRQSPDKSFDATLPLDSLRSNYLSCRKSILSLHSPLGSVLSSAHPLAHAFSTTCQHIFLAVLLSLNFALYEYRNDLHASIYYLETLARNLKLNSMFDHNTGRTKANIETLNWFLVVGGLDRRGEDGAWVQSEFERKLMVTDALKVLARVGDETRAMVQEALYGFLMNEEDVPSQEHENRSRTWTDGENRRGFLPLNDGVLTRIRVEVLDSVDA